jgi:drug/metabolite transporter (DMT)-like permease
VTLNPKCALTIRDVDPVGTASDLFYGLSTAFGYGTSDFVARQASHRIGHVRVLFYMELVGFAILAPIAVVLEHGTWRWSAAWWLVLGLGALNTFATLFLYRSFEYGVLSVVSPIASSYPAVTAALAILFLNDRPGLRATLGILFVLGGILLLSRGGVHPANAPPKDARLGILSAFGAFAGYGIFYFALKYVVADVGPVTVATAVRLVGVVVLLILAAAGVLQVRGLPRPLWSYLGAMGVLDSLAFIAFNVGILGGSVAIVGTLSGLFSAVTVVLAAAILRERLTRLQAVGVASIFVGVVLIALG